jgi:hypothetical protein
MSAPSPGELVALQEELQRRLTMGQPPAVAAEMQRRFIVETLPLGAAAWAAFTFPVGLAFVRQIPALPLLGVAPEWIEHLRELVHRLRILPVPPWSEPIDWHGLCSSALDRLERAETPIGHGEIGIPVLGRSVGEEGTHPLFADLSVAGMLRLRVEVDRAQRRGVSPQFFAEGDTSPHTRAAIENALRNVRALPAWGAPDPHQCVFRASWDMPGARLVGRSGSLAFLLAAAVARAHLSPSPWERSIPDGLAATGDLDGTAVLPVDPDGLLAKVRASHHARIRVLLVPEGQQEDAAREADRMARVSPGHRVQVIGVDDARRIWNAGHGLVRTARGPTGFASGLLNWLTWSRARIALLLAVFGSIVSSGVVTTIRWEKDPVAAEWQDGRLLMRNRYGHTWSLEVTYPPGPDVLAQPDWGVPVAIVKPRGFERSIGLAILGSNPGGSDRLVAISPTGRILWENGSLRIGARHRMPIDDVSWRAIYVAGPDRNGSVAVFAIRRSIQSNLCLIDRIDAATGASRGCLRNRGHIEFSRMIDLTGDAVPEIVFMGTHNPDSCGIAVVIDPDRLRPIAASDSLPSIPNVTDPASLRMGVAACWSFAHDHFSTQLRSSCHGLYPDGVGVVRLAASGAVSEGSFLYRLRTADPRHPVVLGVQITDAFRAFHNGHLGNPAPAGEIEAEQSRLARGARSLTEDGWAPMGQDAIRISDGTADGN